MFFDGCWLWQKTASQRPRLLLLQSLFIKLFTLQTHPTLRHTGQRLMNLWTVWMTEEPVVFYKYGSWLTTGERTAWVSRYSSGCLFGNVLTNTVPAVVTLSGHIWTETVKNCSETVLSFVSSYHMHYQHFFLYKHKQNLFFLVSMGRKRLSKLFEKSLKSAYYNLRTLYFNSSYFVGTNIPQL